MHGIQERMRRSACTMGRHSCIPVISDELVVLDINQVLDSASLQTAPTRVVDGDDDGRCGGAGDELADAPLQTVPSQCPGLVQAVLYVVHDDD